MNHSPMQQENNTASESHLYRWDYSEQVKADRSRAKNANRHGALAYALIMACFFLLLIGVLIFSVVWFGDANKNTSNSVTSAISPAEGLLPSVVLIYAEGDASSGYGTGFFIRSDGYIATNAHVVKGREHISVTLYGGTVHEASLVGISTVDDLAVLKIKGKDYPVMQIGDSESVRVGEMAIAIGNPSGTEAPWTVTQGIVSAKNRLITVEETNHTIELSMLQFDAPVNSGNSGGPLCNDNGEVIGVVTRKLADVEGIGLALPINGAMELLNVMIETGSVKGVVSSISRVRPILGITVVSVKKGETYEYGSAVITVPQNGVLVNMVTPGSAADGFLQPGDIIVSMDGVRIETTEELTELMYGCKSGQRIRFLVIRNNAETEVDVRLKSYMRGV